MANLTADVIHKTYPRAGRVSYVVKNATTLYAGALVGTDANGYLDNFADASGMKFVGILLAGVTGNTSATPKVEGRVDTKGATLKGVALSGAAQADVNSLVHNTTGNVADISLSAGTNVKAIGYISRLVSSGVVDVTLFTPEEHLGL